MRPYTAQKARRIPLHQEVEAKRMTEDLLKQGIIKQQRDNYTSWCSPAMFVPKKPTGLRMVTDYTQLNKQINRPVHPFPTTEDVQCSIHPRSRYFAKIDLVSAYHQIPLAEQDQSLTMFLLPWGCFFYTRVPMGLAPSGDFACYHTDEALK